MIILRAITTLDDETPKGSEFTSNLKDVKGDLIQIQQNSDGEIIFDALSFSSDGTFLFKKTLKNSAESKMLVWCWYKYVILAQYKHLKHLKI